MKRFLAGTSMNNINDSKKSKSVSTSSDLAELAVDDPGHFDEARAPPTEIDGIEQIKHTTHLSNHYLFYCKLYDIVSNIGTKLTAKCVLCLKPIQGQNNSSGNFLSHIKVSF
ncbi:unnamed protein product [Macrosiphum euphorbiae]|uniref:BED-type domain-containing protein n=1 Tax=Macrosiphum euphorbiae TaxID=13131 RepID=A0AAV0XSL6_9HEMI|nr:unnamed protein product [Macrosiphum euphorbiae]